MEYNDRLGAVLRKTGETVGQKKSIKKPFECLSSEPLFSYSYSNHLINDWAFVWLIIGFCVWFLAKFSHSSPILLSFLSPEPIVR